MTLTAKYQGTCSKCGGKIYPGDKIDWNKDTRKTSHIECPQVKKENYGFPVYTLKAGGIFCDWQVNEVVKNYTNQDAPEYLVVLKVEKKYYREDGMSFGLTTENGTLFVATCREATSEEAAPLKEKLDASANKKARRIALSQAAETIKDTGEKPEGTNKPEGETIGDSVAWFVVGTDYIWYVKDNSTSGDDWSYNNVYTGGAGAIGWRIPFNQELASKIKG